MHIRILRIAFVLLVVALIKDVSPPYKHINASPLNKQFVQRPVVQPPPAVKPAESPKPEQARLKETPPPTQVVVAPITIATPAQAQEIAKTMASQRGWTGYQWDALVILWNGESGWNMNSWNTSSGACGIPQSLPCSKIPNWRDVNSQLTWGMDYIARTYGTPANALAKWQARSPHWY